MKESHPNSWKLLEGTANKQMSDAVITNEHIYIAGQARPAPSHPCGYGHCNRTLWHTDTVTGKRERCLCPTRCPHHLIAAVLTRFASQSWQSEALNLRGLWQWALHAALSHLRNACNRRLPLRVCSQLWGMKTQCRMLQGNHSLLIKIIDGISHITHFCCLSNVSCGIQTWMEWKKQG